MSAATGDTANRRTAPWSAAIRRVRDRIEKVLGATRRSDGAACARWRGLAETALRTGLAFMACNLRRATAIRSAAAARGARPRRPTEAPC